MSQTKLLQYGQYKHDIFSKLNFDFKASKKILDVGCGDGSDAIIFIEHFGLNTYASDIFEHKDIKLIPGLKFELAGIYDLPYPDDSFDYVFLHDVLHHIDEPQQRPARHTEGLNEIKRICRPDGNIVIVEANRYNPLFYPHMVKMRGHDHFTQAYFRRIILSVFPNTRFQYFEAHAYPWGKSFWRTYELLMENIVPTKFAAYNVAIIQP